jgi:TRIAD3 protein (E3 ubiquitin-protein ligase RNF216)
MFHQDQMIQCPEAHLFCKSCMTSYASNLLGEHNPNIVCMDQSGCTLPFPESELGRFLSSKLLALYYRVKQRKEIEAAGLENLEECPFCEYRCVIDNEMEKLFRCENAGCSAITCRMCKKPVSTFCLCSTVRMPDVKLSRLTSSVGSSSKDLQR